MPAPADAAAGAAGAVPAVSNGVLSKLTHVPRRSGWPSGVRGTVHALGVWAAADPATAAASVASATNLANMAGAAGTPAEGTSRGLIGRLIGHLRE